MFTLSLSVTKNRFFISFIAQWDKSPALLIRPVRKKTSF
ncbi:hypothetical protein X965_07650 [Morganella sp. EGD-HP17]|nr:hypothetical protein X965_07650 [Morganella sp. EGD-HP17]